MANVVLGVFSEKQMAEDAISELESRGYSPKDMSIIMRDTSKAERFSEETGTENVVRGTLGGAATGAVVGGIAGLVAAFMLPGLGAIFIGGPLAEALGLTGAAATTVSGATTGVLAGGIIGALNSAFRLSDRDARMYEDRIKEGGILIAVPIRQGEEERVTMVMEDFDADNIKTVEASERMGREERPSREYAPAYFSEMRPKKENRQIGSKSKGTKKPHY